MPHPKIEDNILYRKLANAEKKNIEPPYDFKVNLGKRSRSITYDQSKKLPDIIIQEPVIENFTNNFDLNLTF